MSRNTKQPIQFYRGTTAQHSGYTGPAGECTVDTTKNTLVVHDGVKAGGYPLVKEDHTVTGDGYVLANGSRSTTIGSKTLALSLDTAALKNLLADLSGTDAVAGNLKLSDAVDSSLDAATGGTAATPKAVKTAVDGAVKKTYVVKGDTYIKVDGKFSTTLDDADGLDLTLDTAALKSALADPTATNVVSGNNMLSDAVDSSLDAATGGTAATPKAVKAAYDKAAEAITASRTLASVDSPGVVQVGDNLSIDRYGVLRVDTSAYNVYLDGVNGLDTNDGLTADTPVKTVTRAFQCFYGVSRYSPQPHILHVAAGTYTDAAFSVNGMIHPPMMVNFAPGARTISNVEALNGGQAVISGSLTIDNTGFDIKQHGSAIGARQSGKLFIVNLNAVIRGNFNYALYSDDVSIVYDRYNPFDSTGNQGNTIHFDSVSFTDSTAVSSSSSLLYLARTTCTGTATGHMYHCSLLGNIVVFKSGDREDFFPGSGAGVIEFNSSYYEMVI